MSKINIIQHGMDGVGHQLHGLFSCLILHNIRNYYFDGYAFIKKRFYFQHLSKVEMDECKKYMVDIVINFIKKYEIKEKKYNKYIHSHEVYKIPKNTDENILYGLDNAYYFDRLDLNEEEKEIHNKNIDIVGELFKSKNLPECRLNEKNIVIHIRKGDALITGRGKSLMAYEKQMIKLLEVFFKKYNDYTYYIHSDGNIDNIIEVLKKSEKKYFFYDKRSEIMNLISDFINAKIFVSSNSGLSKVCSFIGKKELIIINDDNKHSMPNNTYRISEYLENAN